MVCVEYLINRVQFLSAIHNLYHAFRDETGSSILYSIPFFAGTWSDY